MPDFYVSLDLSEDEHELLCNALDTCISQGYERCGLDTDALQRMRDVLQVRPNDFSSIDSNVWRAVAALEYVRDKLTSDTELSTIAELTSLAERINDARNEARQQQSDSPSLK